MLGFGNNFTGNRAGAFLFAIHAENPREFIETSGAEDVLGGDPAFTMGFPGLAAHAHIDLTFPLKAEAPRGLVKLTGTHSQDEHDPIYRWHSQTPQHVIQLHILVPHPSYAR